MKYLSGCFRSDFVGELDLGWMFQPGMGNNPNLLREAWAIDTGLFNKRIEHLYVNNYSQFRHRYVSYLLSRRRFSSTCLFVTAPDFVGDANRTLLRSIPWFHSIRQLGYRAAFVGQDGAEHLVDRIPWSSFDVLFLGGSTSWKLSDGARSLSANALERGLSVHMGRVNSFRRWKIARSFGCSSADGTILAFGPHKNIRYVRSWLAWSRALAPSSLLGYLGGRNP